MMIYSYINWAATDSSLSFKGPICCHLTEFFTFECCSAKNSPKTQDA